MSHFSFAVDINNKYLGTYKNVSISEMEKIGYVKNKTSLKNFKILKLITRIFPFVILINRGSKTKYITLVIHITEGKSGTRYLVLKIKNYTCWGLNT